MKHFLRFSAALCISALTLASGCGRTQQSSLLDKDPNSKAERLRNARMQFLLESERPKNLETALLVFDLERAYQKKIESYDTINKKKDAIFREDDVKFEPSALRSHLGAGTGAVVAANLISSLMRNPDVGSMEYPGRLSGSMERKTSIRLQLGFTTASLLGMSGYIGGTTSSVHDKVKLTEAEVVSLSRQIMSSLTSPEFATVGRFLGLDIEDQRELLAAFRKAVIDILERDYMKTGQEVLMKTFYMDLDRKVSFLTVAKNFVPSRKKVEYQERVESLGEFVEAYAVAQKVLDTKDQEFVGKDSIRDRIEVLEAYKLCLDKDEKLKIGRFDHSKFSDAKLAVERRISDLKELEEILGAKSKK